METFSSSPRVLGEMANEMAGGRELVPREADRVAGIGQRVARAGLLQLGQGDDVAGAGFFDGLGLLALHEQDVAGALLLAGALVEQLGVGGDLAREDAGEVDAAGELVVDGLEDEQSGRSRVVAGKIHLFAARDPEAPCAAPRAIGDGMDSRASSSRSEPMFLVAATGIDRADGAGGHSRLERVARPPRWVSSLPSRYFSSRASSASATRSTRALARLGGRIGHVVGDGPFGALAGRAGIGVGLHGHQVDHALETGLVADGQRHGHHFVAEAGLERGHRLAEVGPLAVHHVDGGHPGHAHVAGALPHALGLDLDLGHGVDQHEDALDDGQRAQGLVDERGLARGVDEVDPVTGPIDVGEPGGDGHLPLDLVLVVVHGRGAVHDRTQPVLGAGGEQQSFDQRGLTRTAVAHHRDVPDLGRVYAAPWILLASL